jgi:hypothetical protein
MLQSMPEPGVAGLFLEGTWRVEFTVMLLSRALQLMCQFEVSLLHL